MEKLNTDEYSSSEYSSDSDSDSDSDSGSDDDDNKDIKKYEINGPHENNNANIDEILNDKTIITDNLPDILNVDSDLTNIDEYMNNIRKQNEDKIIKKDIKI